MKSQQYKAGWNLRLQDANAKLPRNVPKNYEFLDGFADCNSACVALMAEYMRSDATGLVPVPAAL